MAELSVNDYVEGILRGDVTVLSRAVTLVESLRPEHQAVAQEVIERCLPYHQGSSFLVEWQFLLFLRILCLFYQ
mgnify:CR=1 FL=1